MTSPAIQSYHMQDKSLLESVHALKGNNLIVRYLEDVKHKLQLREMSSGKILKTYNIPIGSISHLSCRRKDSDFFFKLTSFTNPGIAYHCQIEKENEPYILHRTVVESIHEDDFVTTQVKRTTAKTVIGCPCDVVLPCPSKEYLVSV